MDTHTLLLWIRRLPPPEFQEPFTIQEKNPRGTRCKIGGVLRVLLCVCYIYARKVNQFVWVYCIDFGIRRFENDIALDDDRLMWTRVMNWDAPCIRTLGSNKIV